MASRAGLLVMAAVDTVMAGRAGTGELAYYGIAVMPQLALLLVGIGGLMGTVVLTAQTDGAGHPERCGPIWRLALLNALGLGTLSALLLLPGEALLLLLGQDPAIAAGGGRVLAMFALGMPAILMYSATTLFLEGLGRSVPGMAVMALANLVNLGLNWLLMFGPWELGAAGAALATSLTRWFMLAALAGYVLLMPGRERYRIRLLAPLAGHWRIEARLLRLGWPMALSFGLETGAFFAAATFAGWQGAERARRLADRPQHHGAGLHAGDRARDRDRGPRRQRGRPPRPRRDGARRLARARHRRRHHAGAAAAAAWRERADRAALHRRPRGDRDRRAGPRARRLDPGRRRQPGHPHRRLARRRRHLGRAGRSRSSASG